MNNMNNFLYATMNPKGAQNPTAPTNDLTPTIPKQLSVVQEYTMPSPTAGDVMFVFYPYSSRPMVQLYQRVAVGGSQRFVASANLLPSQDLSLKYSRIRLVSGYLAIVSNTISTTNSNLSGTVNMVLANNLPRFSTLTPSTLQNIANMPKNFTNQAKASVGVVNLVQPAGRYRLRQLSPQWPTSTFVRSLTTGSQMTRFSDDEVEVVYVPASDPGWSAAVIITGTFNTMWAASNSTATFPNNLIGRMRVTGHLYMTAASASAAGGISIQLASVHYSSTNFVAVTTQTTVGTLTYGSPVANSLIDIPLEFDFESCTPLADLYIIVTNTTGGNLTPSASSFFKIELLDTQTPEYGPVFLNTISGLSPSQVVSINMFSNFDAVPDPSLNEDIKPIIRVSDITEIDVARYMWTLDPELKAVYTETEFAMMLSNAVGRSRWSNIANKAISNSGGGTAAAADWGGFLNTLKSIGRVALNVVPGVIGAFNPGAGIIAGNVAQAIAPAFAAEMQRGYTSEQQAGYSSSVLERSALPRGYATDSTVEKITGIKRKREKDGAEPEYAVEQRGKTYHCLSCDHMIGRPNETHFRAREHVQQQHHNCAAYCGQGLCMVARSTNRIFPMLTKDVEHHRDMMLGIAGGRHDLDTYVVSNENGAFCVNCLGKIDAEAFKTLKQKYKKHNVAHASERQCCSASIAERMKNAAKAQKEENETASEDCHLAAILKEYYNELDCLRETQEFTAWLSKRKLLLMQDLLDRGAEPTLVRKVLAYNAFDPKADKIWPSAAARGKASDLVAKMNALKLKPKEAAEKMVQVQGSMDFDKATGSKPNAGLSKETLLQLNNHIANPLRSDVSLIAAAVRSDPFNVWWSNRCIIVSENGTKSDMMSVCLTFAPVANKRDQVFNYKQHDVGPLSVFIDDRLESQGPEVVLFDSAAFEVAKLAKRDLYLTARMPTSKDGRVKYGSIIGHSWYFAAYAAQNFANDTILYSGSLDNILGDIGEKVVLSLFSGLKIALMNVDPAAAASVNMILNMGQIEGVPECAFLPFGEKSDKKVVGYYINKQDFGVRTAGIALAASTLLSNTDTKWESLQQIVQKEVNTTKYGSGEAVAKRNWQQNATEDEKRLRGFKFDAWWVKYGKKYESMTGGKGKPETVKGKFMRDDKEGIAKLTKQILTFGIKAAKGGKAKPKTVASMTAFRDRLAAARNPQLAQPSVDDDNDDTDDSEVADDDDYEFIMPLPTPPS